MATPTFPLLFNNLSSAQFPVTREIVFDTKIDVAPNGSEQRYSRNVPLFRFTFPYNSLRYTDEQVLLAFFNNQYGMDMDNWSAVMQAQTYANLTFDQDSIQFSQADPLLWSVSLKFHQTQNAGYAMPAAPTAFPNFTAGKPFQRPYEPIWRNLTVVGDSPTGSRYTYRFYNGGIAQFPDRPLRSWALSYPVLSDADVAILENFFVGCRGRYVGFQLTDDEGTTYHFCRFGTDTLTLTYFAPGQTRAAFTIEEFWSVT